MMFPFIRDIGTPSSESLPSEETPTELDSSCSDPFLLLFVEEASSGNRLTQIGELEIDETGESVEEESCFPPRQSKMLAVLLSSISCSNLADYTREELALQIHR